MFPPKTDLSLAQCCMADTQVYEREEEQWDVRQTGKILCHDDNVGGKLFLSFSAA